MYSETGEDHKMNSHHVLLRPTFTTELKKSRVGGMRCHTKTMLNIEPPTCILIISRNDKDFFCLL